MSQSVVALAVVLSSENIIRLPLFDLHSFLCSVTNYNYSFVGDIRVFACTGVVIGCNELTTRVLTSASLIKNSHDEAKVAHDLKIGNANNSLTP